jgi:hypothetical protein
MFRWSLEKNYASNPLFLHKTKNILVMPSQDAMTIDLSNMRVDFIFNFVKFKHLGQWHRASLNLELNSEFPVL